MLNLFLNDQFDTIFSTLEILCLNVEFFSNSFLFFHSYVRFFDSNFSNILYTVFGILHRFSTISISFPNR